MTELATKEQQAIANQALATINPEQYVAAVYESFKSRAQQAIESVKGIEYDIKTTEGMETAKKARALFREIRLDSEKERKVRKEPLLSIGKLLESGNNEVAAEVEPYETKFDADIKAEEKRKEDIKAEEIRKESQRIAELEAKINTIKNSPLEAINLDSVSTQEIIDSLSVIMPTAEVYQERTVEVEILLEQTIQTLKQMADGKRAQEQLAHQQNLAAKESERVLNIKNKINLIRFTILEGSEIEESQKLKDLIIRVENTVICNEIHQEFTEEATQARDSALKALNRQLSALVLAEQAAVADANCVEAGLPTVNLICAADLAKPEKVVTAINVGVLTNSDPYAFPTASFQKVFAATEPTRNDIISLVAGSYNTTPQQAESWLLNMFAVEKAA